MKENRAIMGVKGNQITYIGKVIQEQFVNVFSGLYEKFVSGGRYSLNDTPTVMFMTECRKIINQTITIQEISQAIKNMKKDKAPGPDGVTGMFYNNFKEVLMMPLQKVMSEIKEGKTVPPTC